MTVDRIRARLQVGELRRSILLLVGGASLGQAIVVVTSPIISRLFTPAEVGAYSVASALLSVLIVIACLRYEWAIPLPESDQAAANVVALCAIVSFVVTAICGVLVWLASPIVLGFVRREQVLQWVALIAFGQWAGGLLLAYTGWAIRTKSFARIARNRLSQSLALVAVQIAFGILRAGALGMVVGAAAGQFAGAIGLRRVARRTHGDVFRRVSLAGIRYAASRYRRFPLFSSESALLNALGEQAPLLLIVATYGTEVGGQFALAVRIGALPVTLIASAVAQVFVAETARLARDHPAQLRTMFGRTTRSLAVMAIGPAIAIAIIAPLLTGAIFGSAWTEAGLYVSILMPMFFLQLVTSPTGGTLDVLERQDLHLVREVLRLVLVGLAALIAVSWHLPELVAIGVFSVAGCLTYIAYGLTSWRAIISQPSRAATSSPS